MFVALNSAMLFGKKINRIIHGLVLPAKAKAQVYGGLAKMLPMMNPTAFPSASLLLKIWFRFQTGN